MCGADFFEVLISDSEFCMRVGRAFLECGRLEGNLIRYLEKKIPSKNFAKRSLGQLIRIAETYEALDQNFLTHLKITKDQRDYMAHNIHALFTGLVEQTILPNEVVAEDIDTFREYAIQFEEGAIVLADSVEEKLSALSS